jgi:HEAT repeat protein
MGAGAKPAVPFLKKALNDKDPMSGAENYSVELAVAKALWQINRDSDEVLGTLIGALRDNSAYSYEEAAPILGGMGPAAQQAIPALIDLLKYTEVTEWCNDYKSYLKMRGAPFQALARLGPLAAQAVPALREYLKETDPGIRILAAEALWNITSSTTDVEDPLAALLRDRSGFVRCRAADAVGQIGPNAKRLVPALAELLRDEYDDVTVHAARALGQIGPSARTAVPSLIRVLKGTDEESRAEAAQALMKIDPAEAKRLGGKP